MNGGIVAVLSVSLVLQVGAAVLAVQLLRKGRGTRLSRQAWLVVALGLSLMAARRAATLLGFFIPSVEATVKGPIAEVIALAIAGLMFVGVFMVGQVFDNLKLTTDESETRLHQRAQAESALQNVEEQLRQSQKLEAVGRLAGGVAHDFNNLLTVINGCSELVLEEDDLPPRVRSHVEQARQAGVRASALTRQLLAFSRRQLLQPSVFDLNTIVMDMDKMLRRMIGADIDVLLDLAPDLPKVKADPHQVEQVLMNLVLNARDAMPSGGKLTIETANVVLDDSYVQAHVEAKPGQYVVLCVSDTGHGMDAETQARVFEPFFTTKPKDKGTGLGLSTAYGIVRQSGGTVAVYSELAKGSTFKVYLPVRAVDEQGEVSDAEPTPRSSQPLGRETVLLVEDEPLLRPFISGVLRRSGYDVLEAKDGQEALRVSAEHHGLIGLVITDLVMPQIGGLELIRRLTRHQPDMRVLYISGYAEGAALHQQGLPAGAFYLQKPFTAKELGKKVREVLA